MPSFLAIKEMYVYLPRKESLKIIVLFYVCEYTVGVERVVSHHVVAEN